MHYNRRGRRAGSSTAFAARRKIDRQQRSDENAPVTVAWAIGALIIFAASLVMGLAGFGIALIAMAFLPWVMSPVTAVALLTIYALVFSIVMVIPLVREIVPRALVDLLVGSAVGTPLGVWILATLPVTALNRLIGAFLLLVCLLEFRRALSTQATGRGWGLSAGFLSGVIGAALGTPGPPVIVYASAQNWSPRAFKANVTGFFVVNQAVILVGRLDDTRRLAGDRRLRRPRPRRGRGGSRPLRQARPGTVPSRRLRAPVLLRAGPPREGLSAARRLDGGACRS